MFILTCYTPSVLNQKKNLEYDFISRVVIHKQSCKHADKEQDDIAERH